MAHRETAGSGAERVESLAAQRERAAFAPLYERYGDQIHAYVYTLTHDMEQANDVTAATFAKAIEELPRFEWRGVPYSAWLYRVAGNLVSRERRRPGWIELEPRMLPDAAADPSLHAEANDRADAVRAAVAALPHDQRQAILLRFRGDLRNREIAEILGRSEGAVKLLTFRALTALRRRLGAPGRPNDRLRRRPTPGQPTQGQPWPDSVPHPPRWLRRNRSTPRGRTAYRRGPSPGRWCARASSPHTRPGWPSG